MCRIAPNEAASRVAATTISRFESGKPANSSTLRLLKQAFEANGLLFIEADEKSGAGVRWLKP